MKKLNAESSKIMQFSLSIEEIDPRIDRCKKHLASNICFLTLAAVFCGAKTWNEIADYGEASDDFFREELDGWESAPSHDTIRRFFMIIPTDKFEHLFRSWVIGVIGHYSGVIAFDGKTNHNASETDEEKSNRKSGYKDYTHKSKLHMITAYATELGFSLGQLRVDDKSNEIPAVQQLIDEVFIPGCTFTADAMHCQKETAKRVLENGGNYFLPVKGNQKELHSWLQQLMDECIKHPRLRRDDRFSMSEQGHGRDERRTCYSMGDMMYMHRFARQWPGMRTVGCIISERYDSYNHTFSSEYRYFISSLPNNAEMLLKTAREHWNVENNLHWHMDVTFGEDDDRKKNNAAQNFAVIEKMVLAVLKNNELNKPINRKRFRASIDRKYLWQLLNQFL